MIEKDKSLVLPDEVIINKIYLIRGQKVMIDRDLAQLYGVETKQLKRQVRISKAYSKLADEVPKSSVVLLSKFWNSGLAFYIMSMQIFS